VRCAGCVPELTIAAEGAVVASASDRITLMRPVGVGELKESKVWGLRKILNSIGW
jgi:hypothetical protein